MFRKTILGTGLGMIFFVVSYMVYVKAIVDKDQMYLLISTFIFFFPTLIACAEELESTRLNKLDFLFRIIALCFGFILLGVVLYFFFLSSNLPENDIKILRILAVVIPAFFIPIKVVPFVVALAQCYNKQMGTNK